MQSPVQGLIAGAPRSQPSPSSPRRSRARRRCGGPRERRAGHTADPTITGVALVGRDGRRHRMARGPSRAPVSRTSTSGFAAALRRRRLVGQRRAPRSVAPRDRRTDRQRRRGQAHAVPRVGRLEGRNHSGDQCGDVRRRHRQSGIPASSAPPTVSGSAIVGSEAHRSTPARGWATHRSRTRTSGSAATRTATPATRSRARRARSTRSSTPTRAARSG